MIKRCLHCSAANGYKTQACAGCSGYTSPDEDIDYKKILKAIEEEIVGWEDISGDMEMQLFSCRLKLSQVMNIIQNGKKEK